MFFCLGFRVKLFNLNLGTSLFKRFLEGLGLLFGDAFLDGLGGTVNEFLSFLQAKAGEFLHQFHNLQLLAAGGFQDDVELGFLFRGGSATSGGTSGHGDCGGGGFDTDSSFKI